MAVSAKDSKLLEQKDLISQLNTTIAAQTELIQSLKKDHEADREQIQNLLAQVDYLTKKLFGTSSEKMKDVEGQLNLFDEAEQEADVDLKAPVIKVPEHTRRKKRTLEELFKGVPSRDEIISLPEGERVCDECGAALEPIGKEFVRHEFRFTPAKGEDGLPPIVLYHYTETRARYNAVDFFDGFRTDTWKRMVIRVIIISLVSGAAPAGRIQEDTSLMRFQKESSMITAIRQYRESSSVQSFLSMSADHITRSTHLSREKPIVLKKKNRYSTRSGAGLTSRSHVREAVSRQR